MVHAQHLFEGVARKLHNHPVPGWSLASVASPACLICGTSWPCWLYCTAASATTHLRCCSPRSLQEKDPNAPKKPLGAYFFYQNEVRAKVRSSTIHGVGVCQQIIGQSIMHAAPSVLCLHAARLLAHPLG